MNNLISHKRLKRFGAMGLLLVVQFWVSLHVLEHHTLDGIRHEHGHAHENPVHAEFEHDHHPHVPHSAHEHALATVRFENTIAKTSPVILTTIAVTFEEPATYIRPFDADEQLQQSELIRLTRPRAPPAPFFA